MILYCILVFLSTTQVMAGGGCGAPTVTMTDGRSVPGIAFGTWKAFTSEGMNLKPYPGEVEIAVRRALVEGYRHFDMAFAYENEDQVGAAIQAKIDEGLITREDVFITSKLFTGYQRREKVEAGIRASLKNLKMNYVDLYLIHVPVGTDMSMTQLDDDADFVDTWRGMLDIKKKGLARSVGVCNMNITQLQRLIRETGVKPALVQIEVNLNFQNEELRAYLASEGIPVMAHSPMGSLVYKRQAPNSPPAPREDDPLLLEIAEKYGKTVPQINLRYLREIGTIPIPKSRVKCHIEENYNIFDFRLTRDLRRRLRSFETGYRMIPLCSFKSGKYYPFGNLTQCYLPGEMNGVTSY